MQLGTRPAQQRLWNESHPRPRLVRAIAHRGASIMVPENTLLAFRLAVEAGVDAVETDARLTADGEIVLLHDADLTRTTNGSGRVGAWRLAELRGLDAGYWCAPYGAAGRPFRGLGLGIPTLAELFGLLDQIAPHMQVHVEIKNMPSDADFDRGEQVADAVARWLRDAEALDRACVSSFSHAALERVKALEPGLRTAVLIAPNADLGAALACAVARGHDTLHPHHALVDMNVANSAALHAAQAEGLEVNVWTVNDPARMRELAAWGVDGVLSDDPQRLCAMLDAR